MSRCVSMRNNATTVEGLSGELSDELSRLEAVITSVISLHSSLLSSTSLRSFLPTLSEGDEELLLRIPEGAEKEIATKFKPFGSPRSLLGKRPPTSTERAVDNNLSTTLHSKEKEVPQEQSEPNLAQPLRDDGVVDFDVILKAMADERVASKNQSNNPYVKSAAATLTAPYLLLGREALVERQLSVGSNRSSSTKSPSTKSPYVGSYRASNVDYRLFPAIQWTDRLRPFLILQLLRVIRLELLPLLPCISNFNAEATISFCASRDPRLFVFNRISEAKSRVNIPLLKVDNSISKSSTDGVVCVGAPTIKPPFPGLVLPFSCLHRFIASLVSLRFQPADSYCSLKDHRPVDFDYRFPVDEEFMCESFSVLITLQHNIASLVDDRAAVPNAPSILSSSAFPSLIQSVKQDSFQRSIDACLLRSQYEILPRSVLMMLCYKNILKKSGS